MSTLQTADTGTIASQAASQAPTVTPGAEGPLSIAANSLGQVDTLFSWGSYFQALAFLFLIVAILFAALWFLKRKGGLKVLTRQGDLAVENRLALGPKKSLLVVRFLNKRLLLGVTDQQITMLTELSTDEDDTPLPAPSAADSADFTALLTRAEKNNTDDSQ
jgi:flagellar biosynthetic protein FliO